MCSIACLIIVWVLVSLDSSIFLSMWPCESLEMNAWCLLSSSDCSLGEGSLFVFVVMASCACLCMYC